MAASNYDLQDYDPSKWVDKDDYWLYDVEQRHPAWLLVKKGRPSGSTIGGCLDCSNFTSPTQAAMELSGRTIKQFTSDQLEAMNHGTVTEPGARNWYARNNNVQVEELGFVVPKWDLEIGVSVDGDVIGTDGMIEIKAPKRMYMPLVRYMERQRHNFHIDSTDFSHIWMSHFLQMQLGMAVLKKKWCDYVVYCTPENKIFCQRVPFMADKWEKEWYPKLRDFIDNRLNPLLVNTPYPLMPEGN